VPRLGRRRCPTRPGLAATVAVGELVEALGRFAVAAARRALEPRARVRVVAAPLAREPDVKGRVRVAAVGRRAEVTPGGLRVAPLLRPTPTLKDHTSSVCPPRAPTKRRSRSRAPGCSQPDEAAR
jgi:hypothetical protein